MDDTSRLQQLQNNYDSLRKKFDEMCARMKDIHDKYLSGLDPRYNLGSYSGTYFCVCFQIDDKHSLTKEGIAY